MNVHMIVPINVHMNLKRISSSSYNKCPNVHMKVDIDVHMNFQLNVNTNVYTCMLIGVVHRIFIYFHQKAHLTVHLQDHLNIHLKKDRMPIYLIKILI